MVTKCVFEGVQRVLHTVLVQVPQKATTAKVVFCPYTSEERQEASWREEDRACRQRHCDF